MDRGQTSAKLINYQFKLQLHAYVKSFQKLMGSADPLAASLAPPLRGHKSFLFHKLPCSSQFTILPFWNHISTEINIQTHINEDTASF